VLAGATLESSCPFIGRPGSSADGEKVQQLGIKITARWCPLMIAKLLYKAHEDFRYTYILKNIYHKRP